MLSRDIYSATDHDESPCHYVRYTKPEKEKKREGRTARNE